MALAMQFQLDQTQWLNNEEILEQQLQQLQPLLLHAKNTTAFYKDVIPEELLNRKISWNDFLTLPVLSRENARDNGDQLISNHPPKAHKNIRSTKTSGSTGTPVTIYLSEINAFLWRAFALRDHHWHHRDLSGVLCAIRWMDISVANYPHGIESPNWGIITGSSFNTGKSCLLNINATVDEQLDWLSRKNPDYLLSFPSNIAALAERALEKNIHFPNLKQVRTIGETLKPDLRQLVERAWGIKITDIYTCEEAGYLALQCPDHDHYHIQSENIILEVLNDSNNPCKVGEEGKVVFTSLHNYCSPLIRYELGDRAILGEQCPCGRGLPVLKKIYGRQRNRIVMPDGSKKFPYLGEHGEVYEATGISPRQTQFIQKNPDLIEVLYAVNEPFSAENEIKLTQLHRKNLGSHFQFVYRYVSIIQKGPTGKFEDFICEC